MFLGCYVRHNSELLEPFENGGQFQHLSAEDFAMFAVPDASWDQYGRDSDGQKLARAQAAFFRATFMPSLASAPDCVGDAADQASNAFKSLFEALAAPHSYARSDANLFTCALGRSFYENVLPPNSVHVAWSSYAAVWLSNVPMPIPSDLFCTPQSPAAARAAFERQAASVRECSRGFLAWQIADALVGCFPSWLRISFRHFFVVLAAPMKLPRPRDPLLTLPLPHCEGQ